MKGAAAATAAATTIERVTSKHTSPTALGVPHVLFLQRNDRHQRQHHASLALSAGPASSNLHMCPGLGRWHCTHRDARMRQSPLGAAAARATLSPIQTADADATKLFCRVGDSASAV